MNATTFQQSQNLIGRYLRLSETTKKGWTLSDVDELRDICYRAICIVSDERCTYSNAQLKRRINRQYNSK